MFYKEWIKTRWFFVLSTLVLLGFTLYPLMRVQRVARTKGIDHVWEVLLQHDVVFIDLLQYIPLLIGVLMALVQFVPEMHRKSLKLTFHLPYPSLHLLGTMLLSGGLLLLFSFLLSLGVLHGYLSEIFAAEMERHILLTALPWFVAGLAAYFLLAWICLEPTWKRRVIYLLMAGLMLRMFFLSDTPEAYNRFLPWLCIYTGLLPVLSWNSVIRFKDGKQD